MEKRENPLNGSKIRFGVDIWEENSYELFVKSVIVAEKLGFDSIWAAEAHKFDLLTKLTVAATITKRVKLGTVVLVPSIRNPVVLAKTISALDLVSQGRLILGVGTGGGPGGFENMGIAHSKPTTRMLESIKIMKMLWTESSVTFEGEYYQLKDCVCHMKPIQKPHPPFWIGAYGPHMLEITGKFGDGWLGDGFAYEYKDSLSKIRNIAREFGRNPEEITPARLEFTSIARDHETASSYLPPQPHWFGGWKKITEEEKIEAISTLEKERIFGSPEEYIEGIDNLVKSGVRHFILTFYAPNEKSYLDSLKLCAGKVLPYFKE